MLQILMPEVAAGGAGNNYSVQDANNPVVNLGNVTLTQPTDQNGNVTASPWGANDLAPINDGTAWGGTGGSNNFFDAGDGGSPTFNGGDWGTPDDNSDWGLDQNYYNYTPGDGDVTINPGNSSNDGTLNICVADPGNLTFQADDSTGNLTITDGTTGDQITINAEYSTSNGAPNDIAPAGEQQQAVSTINTPNGSIPLENPTFTWTGTAKGSSYGDNLFKLSGVSAVVTGGENENTYNLSSGTGTTLINSEGSGTLNLAWASTDPMTYALNAATNTLDITDLSNGQQVDIANEYSGDPSYPDASISGIYFGDGGFIDPTQLGFTQTVSSGTTETGTGFGTDTFILSAGTGTAIGSTETADTFVDAPGTHTAAGGSGTNTYDYAAGDGALTITPQINDIIQMAAGITPEDVTYEADKATGNLTILDGTANDQIVATGDLGGSANVPTSLISSILFSDGEQVYVPTGIVSTDNVAAGATYAGSNLVDNLLLIAPGTSTVTGGAQFNNYNPETGSGAGTINLAGTGQLNLGTGASDETTWFTKSGNNLVIEQLGSASTLTIADWYQEKGDLASITTQDGLSISSTAITSLASTMGAYDTAHSFNPATATAMPTNTSLQHSIAGAW
jgi:hypothetical protein